MVMDKAKAKAIELTKNSDHILQRHGAVIVRNGRIISYGWNKMKTHPKSLHPFKAIHAEMDAIFKAKGKAQGGTLYVARLTNVGIPMNSQPCPYCMATMIAAGIRRVFYTDNDGKWTELVVLE